MWEGFVWGRSPAAVWEGLVCGGRGLCLGGVTLWEEPGCGRGLVVEKVYMWEGLWCGRSLCVQRARVWEES